MAAGFILGVVPYLGQGVETAALHFENQPSYIAAVLGGAATRPASLIFEPADITLAMVLLGLVSAAGAVIYALLALFPKRLPANLRSLGLRLAGAPIAWLRAIQSGHIGDYVTWLVIGVAVLGAIFAGILR
jgi:multicomponent Na+:H+ antiporter subunit D